jgi:mRNA-degrading endonuclease RelE of RelBE toxin-antitoxin system
VAEPYDILYAPRADEEAAELSAFRFKEIIKKIEQQLSHEPTKETRNRKYIVGIKPPWAKEEGFWELRVGQYRVFYEVDGEAREVIIQAIRQKPPHKTTEEIL